MRVISGKVKGRKLKSLEGTNTRPTADRIKESLFNIIAPYILNANVLDLFAGTGSLGIEALSRGAATVVFVDNNPKACSIIRENLIHTGLDASSTVLTCDWKKHMSDLSIMGKQDVYDVVFLDPPYSMNMIEPVLNQLGSQKLLKADGLVVVETDRKDTLVDDIQGLKIYRSKKYGRSMINIYCNIASAWF